MTSRIHVLAIDALQPRVVADFWCAALGWEVVEEEEGGIRIAPPDRGWPHIDVIPVPERKQVKNRLHLDLRPTDGGTREQEVERLLRRGATQVADHRRPDGGGWVTLADPEGNEFCVLRGDAEVADPYAHLVTPLG